MDRPDIPYSNGRISRVLEHVMPWLFLSLRRALIPTVCLVILAVLFYIVPQSREVLAGLTEFPAQSSLNTAGAWFTQLCRLLYYLGTSIGLALAVWYAARLLCTVEARLGMPVFWELNLHHEMAKAGVQWAISWLPRTYGVAALAASVGALTYASYSPVRLGQFLALGLVAFGLAGPLAVEIGRIMARPATPHSVPQRHAPAHSTGDETRVSDVSRLRARGRLVRRVGWAAVAISFCLYATVPQTWPVKLMSFIISILPAVLLYILVERRRFWNELFKGKPQNEPDAPQDFETVFRRVIVVICAGLVALLSLAALPPSLIRAVGSAGAIMLFLSAAVLLMTGIQLLLRHVSRAVPGLTTAVVLISVVLLAVIGHEPNGEESLERLDPVQSGAAATGTATAKRVFIVNAYGGGIRAAIYTAQVLALADDASCGEFGNHIVAFSGVSGGSLGVATYLLARQELLPRGLWKNCDPAKETPLTKVVTSALVQDHLSPAIARAVSLDLVPFVAPRRGQALLDSWNTALVAAMKQDPLMENVAPTATLAMPLGKLNGAISPTPTVYFNATDADRGNVVPFSNSGATATILVGIAVLHSARFPVVTPAGSYQIDGSELTERLVDGGYADNSGAQTLSEQIQSKPDSLKLIDIDGNPPAPFGDPSTVDADCGEKNMVSPVPTALLALLQARSAHAQNAANQLARHMPACEALPSGTSCVYMAIFDPIHADNTKLNRCKRVHQARIAPLGWYVGTASAYWIAKSAQQAALNVCTAATAKPCQLPALTDDTE